MRDLIFFQISVVKKTEEYVQSLGNKEIVSKNLPPRANSAGQARTKDSPKIQKSITPLLPKLPITPHVLLQTKQKNYDEPKPKLSPILSPTQNLSIIDDTAKHKSTKDDESGGRNTKILYPSPKSKTGINGDQSDQGSFTSVTASGAFSRKCETKKNGHTRQPSLTKSEIQILTYVEPKNENFDVEDDANKSEPAESEKVTNLPPPVGGVSGKTTPTKIPSPVHAQIARPRSRNSLSSLNIDLSDSSLDTESYLKPTQNYINSLQKRLSLDSDPDSDCDTKFNNIRLNNESQKSIHVRHNSFDDRNLKISNKLEHFQNKNLQGIDQTYTNKFNQYSKMHKIQNSPNNSPIRRSSSFSNKNHIINVQPKVTNLNSSGIPKNSNLR